MNILNLIFPKKCLECGKVGKYICKECLQKVPPSGWAKGDLEVYSLWRYQGVIRKAIIALKYKYATEVVNELADRCVQKLLISHFSLFTTLTPVPLHWRRQNFRGFNQSAEIGKIVARRMGWKFIPDLLIRKKSTTPQVELKGSARRQNLKNVFAVSPNILRHSVEFLSQYPSIVLFDDVFTTGSTLKEAAKVLKQSGVKNVRGLTIAR